MLVTLIGGGFQFMKKFIFKKLQDGFCVTVIAKWQEFLRVENGRIGLGSADGKLG